MPYPFTTAMRLDVEDPSLIPAGNVLNQIGNYDGALGGWGWLTPGLGIVSAASGSGSTFALRLRAGTAAPTTSATSMSSEPVPVTPGTSYIAGWTTEFDGNSWYRGILRFVDATGATVSDTQTSILAASVATRTLGPLTVPTGAVSAALVFHLYASSAGAAPTADNTIRLRDIRMGPTNAATKITLAPAFTNILNASTTITVDREPLSVGTLNASIIGADFDPSTRDLLRTGRRVRLVALGTFNGLNEHILFTGKVSTASVSYALNQRPARRAQINLTAVDAVSDLANTSRPNGVATIDGLRDVLEGAGVPWHINLDSRQIAPQPVISRNESASALDQIAITRDSRRGTAYLDRRGRLIASDTAITGWSQSFGEADYAENLDLSWDLDDVINVVTVRLLRINAATGETVEVPFGPYRHEASVRQWGPRSAEYTVHGLPETEADMKAYADAVFAVSASPAVRVKSMTLRVGSVADLPRGLLELTDQVRVTGSLPGLPQTPRIAKITHRITPTDWLVDLGFTSESSVATPQVTPALVSRPTTTPAPTEQRGVAPTSAFTVGTNQAVPVTFPVPFDVAPNVIATVRGTAVSSAVSAVTVTNQTTTGCVLNLTRSSGTAALSVAWWAFV